MNLKFFKIIKRVIQTLMNPNPKFINTLTKLNFLFLKTQNVNSPFDKLLLFRDKT